MHLNYIFFNKLFSFLAILIPLALITGGFIPDLFLTLIALYFLIKCIHLNYWELFKNKIVILFLIFVLIISLNSLFSSDPFISFFTSIVYIRYLFFSLAIAYFIRYEKNFINYLLASIGLCLIIIIPDTYFQWLTGKNIFGWTAYAENRLSSFFKDELIVGNYISKIFMLMTILLIHQNYSNNLVKLLNTILLIIVNFIVFASGERAAFFHIFSFTIMIVIFSENNFFYFKKFVIISFALFFIIIAFSFESNLKNRMIDHTINQLDENIQYSDHQDNMNALFKIASVIVLPTYYGEGVPKILIESLASGVPIITTFQRGCRELVDNGKNGFICRKKNSKNLSSVFEKFIKLPNHEMKQMSFNCMLYAKNNLSEDKVSENHSVAYNYFNKLI